jgi:hypothetical protein
MTVNATLTTAPARPAKRFSANPASAGLPDPRPLTDYDVTYDEISSHSRISIALKQPCVIRTPAWTFIDSSTGAVVVPATVTPSSNNKIVFEFAGILADTVNLVDVPYQDMQVQNFQGGFVRPGAKWFSRGK